MNSVNVARQLNLPSTAYRNQTNALGFFKGAAIYGCIALGTFVFGADSVIKLPTDTIHSHRPSNLSRNARLDEGVIPSIGDPNFALATPEHSETSFNLLGILNSKKMEYTKGRTSIIEGAEASQMTKRQDYRYGSVTKTTGKVKVGTHLRGYQRTENSSVNFDRVILSSPYLSETKINGKIKKN
jgi:hypothetical protein